MNKLFAGSFKFRWGSLFLLSVVTFILFSNSHHAGLQGEAIAEETPVQVALQTDTEQLLATPDADDVIDKDDGDGDATPPGDAAATETRHSWTIRSGDTLSGILKRFRIYSALGSILAARKELKPIINLKAGKQIHLVVNKEGRLEKLVYELSQTEHLILHNDSHGKITVENYRLPIETREAFAAGFVENSFFLSGLKAGLSDEIIVETVSVLAWDIDFVLDVRTGDFFSVLYEEKFLNGEKVGNGDVLGVEYVNRGKTFRAVRYSESGGKPGYFTPDGKNVKKTFIRTPLEFTRISSRFNPKRLHPILKTTRPHRGVDYAAPQGTPVYAAADGRVTFRGWKAGYGNVVILKHYGAYSTLYAHLSKFARIRAGHHVKQKQTIGYVGMTGYATGPHLHYEFRIAGVHKNPLSVKFPDAKPLPKLKMAAFNQAVTPIISKLDTLNRSYAASARHK